MSYNAPFVVHRPDGHVVVELEVADQLEPDEARQLAAELTRAAAKAEKLLWKSMPRKVAKLYVEDSASFLFRAGGQRKKFKSRAPLSAVRRWFTSRQITHVTWWYDGQTITAAKFLDWWGKS